VHFQKAQGGNMRKTKIKSEEYDIPKTLSQSIYNHLKKSIIDNKFKANQKMDEKEISDLFGVSRTPVREAISQLAAEGFVEIDFHRGAVVKEISFKEIKEIIEVIRVLDGLAMDTLVVEKISERELHTIENMTSKLEHCLHQSQLEKYIKLNFEIHERIWSHTDNDFLNENLRFCLTQIHRYIYALDRVFRQSKSLEKSINDHKAILRALKNKDKKKLKSLVMNHWTPPLSWSEIEKL